jgi:hypothetical protein
VFIGEAFVVGVPDADRLALPRDRIATTAVVERHDARPESLDGDGRGANERP